MRTALAFVLALALPTLLAPATAASEPHFDYDVADPLGDVLRAVRHPDTRELVERPGMDVTRVASRIDGDLVVQELTMAGTPGEPKLRMEVVTFLAGSAEGQLRVPVAFGDGGEAPATASGFIVAKGVVKDVEMDVAVAGNTLRLSMPAAELPDGIDCFHTTANLDLRGSDGAEYSEYVYPMPDLCNRPDAYRDGIDGTCPPAAAPDGDDPFVHDMEDDANDVKQKSYLGEEEVENASVDVTTFTSRRVGDRIVQTVTTAAPLPEGTLKVSVANRVDGENAAFTATLLQFARHDPTPRAEGKADTGASERDFLVDVERDGSAITLSFCASVIPADAPCFSPLVTVAATPTFGTSVEDTLAPAKDACAGKDAATTSPAGGDGDDAASGTPADDASTQESDDTADTPAPGVAIVLVALAAAVLATRRRG